MQGAAIETVMCLCVCVCRQVAVHVYAFLFCRLMVTWHKALVNTYGGHAACFNKQQQLPQATGDAELADEIVVEVE